jgi:hypothetical protein
MDQPQPFIAPLPRYWLPAAAADKQQLIHAVAAAAVGGVCACTVAKDRATAIAPVAAAAAGSELVLLALGERQQMYADGPGLADTEGASYNDV